MRKLFFLAPVVLLSHQLAAQKAFKRTTLYGEILGSGLVLSVNYEHQLKNKPGFAWYAGIGLGGEYPTIPAGIKYLFYSKNEKSFLEAGAGVAFAEKELWDEKYRNTSNSVHYGVGFVPTIGYRHHTRYGLMWRVNYTPFFYWTRTELLFFGISVGWRL